MPATHRRIAQAKTRDSRSPQHEAHDPLGDLTPVGREVRGFRRPRRRQCPGAGVIRPAASKSAHTAPATTRRHTEPAGDVLDIGACEMCDRAEDDHMQVA
jgi:hypothetical protein